MKEECKFKESCAFKNNIAEISSISLECNYEVDDNTINGTFLIEGTYRTHELSINQENFSFKLPFDYRLPNNAKNDSISLKVSDFTYTTEENNLNIEIEYVVNYEMEEEITTQEEFDRFLENHEVEVVDLKEENDEEKIDDYLSSELTIDEEEEKDGSRLEEININTDVTINTGENVANTIIDNISERDNEYITYHVYICTEYDTFNSIADIFKVSLDTLKSYNNIENITSGTKIIIPSQSDEN